jgi:hypothetical protein
MAGEAITKQEFGELVQQHYILHQSVENAIDRAVHLADLRKPAFQRLEALRLDMRILKLRVPLHYADALLAFESFLPSWTAKPCLALAGVMYALECVRKNSLRRVGGIAGAIGVKVKPQWGIDYYIQHTSDVARRLERFRDWLDVNVRYRQRAEEVVRGGQAVLKTLIAFHE